MDSLTAKLRLCYWCCDPVNIVDLIIMERHKMDFGDSVAALIISFVQLKLLMAATKMNLVQEVHRKEAHDDDYNSSFRTIQEYIEG